MLAPLARRPAAVMQDAHGRHVDHARDLMRAMDRNRVRHLRAGFDAPTARHVSDLHTPNLM